MDVRNKTVDIDAKSLKAKGDDGASLGDGIIARFDCVVTTNKEDRDHDIMEPAGAVIDTKMPLLWQHQPDSPIGKYVETVDRDGEKIIARYEVADTELGRDAVSLMKLGILRISHGFRALEYESRTTKEGNGYHFKRFEIVETSLVSIPSNPGAQVLALETKSFESQPVKAWVESIKKGNQMTTLTTTPVDTKAGTLTADEIKTAIRDGMKEAVTLLTKANAGGGNADGAGGTGTKAPTMADLLTANAGGNGGGTDIRVKSIGERYSHETKSLRHFKTGQRVFGADGQEGHSVSQLNAAKHGAYVKRLFEKHGLCKLTEEDRSLLELTLEDKWVGPGTDNDNGVELSGEMMRKDLLNDSLSGGSSAAPFAFDSDAVLFPLLSGELFPWVDLKNLGRGSSVHAFSIANPTVSFGSSEGTDAPMFDTSNMIEPIDSNIYDLTVTILIGRNFLADSPADIGMYVTKTIGEKLAATLDNLIATGNGTNQVLGIINTSGMTSVTADNTTTGPPTLNDYQQLLFAVPKQYRTQANRCAFVSSDIAYGRSRTEMRTDPHPLTGGTTTINLTPLLGIASVNSYETMEWPHRINQGIANGTIIFGALNRFRLYRRLGMELRVETGGLALANRNEIALIMRSRYGGQIVDPAAFAIITDGQT